MGGALLETAVLVRQEEVRFASADN